MQSLIVHRPPDNKKPWLPKLPIGLWRVQPAAAARKLGNWCGSHDRFALMSVLGLLLFAWPCIGGQTADASNRAQTYLTEAKRHFENQQWDQSKQSALKSLELNPRLVDAQVLLGLVATAQQQYREAEKYFLAAATLAPGNDRILVYLGSAYYQDKRLADASMAFQKALRFNPRNQAATNSLGHIALAQGKTGEAFSEFEAAHRSDPADILALTGLLECQLRLKRLAHAHGTLRKLESMLAVSDPRLLQIATMLALHADYGAAVPLMERIYQSSPRSYDVGYNLALAYYRFGDYGKTVATLQTLLRQEIQAEGFNLLAMAEEKRKRSADAIEAYQRATALEPENEDYRFDYANSVLQYLTSKQATDAFMQGVHDFPKSWRMRLGLGSSYYLTGDYEAAVQSLLEAIDLKPDSDLAFYLLGKAYESAPSAQAAIAERFRTYLGKQPRDAWAYCHYGTILYLRSSSQRREDFASAKAYLTKALSLDPNLAEAHLQLGIIALAENQPARSAQLLERSIQLKPEQPAAHYRLALAYQRLGRKEDAKSELERFATLKTARDETIYSLAQRAR